MLQWEWYEGFLDSGIVSGVDVPMVQMAHRIWSVELALAYSLLLLTSFFDE